MNKKVLWITRTALLLALVIVAQFIGKMLPAGAVVLGPMSVNQLITGSLVNMVLAIAVLTVGVLSAVTVGVLSSVLATLIGVGPIFPIITPAIAAGNIIIATVIWAVIKLGKKPDSKAMQLLGIIAGAALKCAFLWVTVPALFRFIPEIKEKQAQTLSIMFSYPQLITGIIGGLLALAVYPALKKALSK